MTLHTAVPVFAWLSVSELIVGTADASVNKLDNATAIGAFALVNAEQFTRVGKWRERRTF